jgi:hypothetical protein
MCVRPCPRDVGFANHESEIPFTLCPKGDGAGSGALATLTSQGITGCRLVCLAITAASTRVGPCLTAHRRKVGALLWPPNGRV